MAKHPVSPRAKNVILAIGASAAVLFLLLLVLINSWNAPHVTKSEHVPDAPITQQHTPPSAYDTVRGWFGPWETTIADTGDPDTIVMLRSNGVVDKSSYAISTDQWPTAQLPDLVIEADQLQVRLRSNSGMVYRIKPGQPFILDTRPNQVYAVTAGPGGAVVIHNHQTPWVHAALRKVR